MELTFQSGGVLLSIAAVVAMLTRRLRLPYSVGLVAAGIGLTLLRVAPQVELTKDLLFEALLPPLIFEAALSLPWKPLRRDFGVDPHARNRRRGLSAGVTGLGMFYLAGWQWQSSLLFGVLIAATDPVSVIATFKEARVTRPAAEFWSKAKACSTTAPPRWRSSSRSRSWGAPLSPLQMVRVFSHRRRRSPLRRGVAGVALLLMGRTEDHLVEMTFTTVAAYGSFLLAERFHLSGVLATLTAGLILGNSDLEDTHFRATGK